MVDERFINIRKLAAFDLHFRNPRTVLFEFGFVVFGIGGLGVAALALGLAKSFFATAIGVYLVFLAVDYLPLLVYGAAIMKRHSAKLEIQEELRNEQYFRRKYGVQQSLLMVPLVVPVLAASQEVGKHPKADTSAANIQSSA